MSEVAVVYDGSALLAYATGRPGAAELISEIGAEGRRVAIPSTCLAFALARVVDDFEAEQLLRLARSRVAVVVPLDLSEGVDQDDIDPVERVRAVAGRARLAGGDITIGHAVVVALDQQAYYVTAHPRQVVAALPADWTLLDITA